MLTDKEWEEFKRFIQSKSEEEAASIMQLVDEDPSLKDVHAPEEIWEKLKKQIEEYEQSKEGGQ